MKLAALWTALAIALPASGSATSPAVGRYDCVLSGQGACSDEGICLGNRISPNDRTVRLTVDFGTGTASLNGIPGRLVKERAGVAVIRWHLSTIDDQRIDLSSIGRAFIVELGPAQGGGSTAAFRCRKRA